MTYSEYCVFLYQKRTGECPTDEFLDSLPVKVRAKLEKWIEQLEIHGPNLPRPFADSLRDKIRELRVRFGQMNYRFLYFFSGKSIILTHGFMKKTSQVPDEEIEKAIFYMHDFNNRREKGEIEL